MAALTIRGSRSDDIGAVAAIYGHWVSHGLASFELSPPGEEEMARRRDAVLGGGHPYLVAEDERGRLLGYAYAGPYRTRPAYRFAVENSVYVAPELGRGGQGVADSADCALRGEGLPPDGRSDRRQRQCRLHGLHRSCGFADAGLLPAAGWKHGRWVDCVLMTRALGPGATTAPEG